MKTLITGGTIVTATDNYKGDVLVDGEKIVMIGKELKAAGAKKINATGKYVIPGGIDVHTHMEMPFGGTKASDTFETGPRAPAGGGVTTIIDFPVQNTGGNVHQALADWHRKADGECAIDYAFHQIIGGVDDDS